MATMSSLVVVGIFVAAAALSSTLLPPISASGAQPPPVPVIGRPGCETRCGNVSVPFPLGFGPARCSATGLNLTCDNTTRPGRPRLLLAGVFEVREISIEKHTLRVFTPPIFSDGARNLSRGAVKKGSWGSELSYFHDAAMYKVFQYYLMLGRSSYDEQRNPELVVVGCNVQVSLRTGRVVGDKASVLVGCSSYCDGDRALTAQDVGNYTGVCRTTIGTWDAYYDVELKRLGDGGANNDDLPVTVLIADADFIEKDLPRRAVQLMKLDKPRGATRHHSRPKEEEDDDDLLLVPVSLGWVCFNDGSCNASVSSNTYCQQDRGELFLCFCRSGYEGNPYVTDGCQDIDECKHHPKENGCFGVCGNKNGSFDCSCPVGHYGDPSLPDGCIQNTGLIIGFSVSVVPSLMLLAIGGIFIIRKFKHHTAERMKQKFFKQNRGNLLQQLVSNRSDIGERMIIPLKEIQKATNDFDQTRKLGGGGHGTVFKGILSDLQVVAIKKSNIVVQREIDEFIKEVAILSQINHRNIVKLHGCCLETEVPLLAYEFISNGTLGEHLHNGSPKSIPWRERLRISSEVAKAIAYLHSAVSVPVIHRDVKSSNILLDDALTAKLSDFGASRYIPTDQTTITATDVQGTIGYLDPMYCSTGQLSDKSDVYSFGVLLVELLTRKKPSMYMPSEGGGLVMHFVKLLEQGNLLDILDSQVMEEGSSEVQEVATLAASCLKFKGEERPTMRNIEVALEGLQATNDHALIDVGLDDRYYISPSYPSSGRIAILEEVSRQYSQEEEFALSARYPR